MHTENEQPFYYQLTFFPLNLVFFPSTIVVGFYCGRIAILECWLPIGGFELSNIGFGNAIEFGHF